MSELEARPDNTRPAAQQADPRYIQTQPLLAPELEAYANEFIDSVNSLPEYRATIGCIIPAYNEEESLPAVLASLLEQTRMPDVIHVVINNTTDRSVRSERIEVSIELASSTASCTKVLIEASPNGLSM